jgi:hypothetical protein
MLEVQELFAVGATFVLEALDIEKMSVYWIHTRGFATIEGRTWEVMTMEQIMHARRLRAWPVVT